MITIHVRYFNFLAAYIGQKSQSLELPDGFTITDLIHKLAQEGPPAFREIVWREDQPNPHLRIFQNDTLVDNNRMKTPLATGDTIMLFPAISGG
jgi:molybdopterin synthase sulfur carrier subunit